MLFGNCIFICVYVCTLARVYFVYVHVCVCLCICMFVEARGQTRGHSLLGCCPFCFFLFLSFFLQVCVCICMRVSTCMCAHVHVCILTWGGLKLTCVLLCTLSRQYLLLNLELADLADLASSLLKDYLPLCLLRAGVASGRHTC